MDDKILHKDSIELAEYQPFIRWVKSGTDDSNWQQWLQQHPDQEVKIKAAKDIVQSFQFEEKKSLNINVAELKGRIDQSIDAKVVTLDQETNNVRKLFRRSFIGIAASLALLLGVVFFMKGDVTVSTPYGEAMVHTMPDQSQVEINAGSTINYDDKNWENNRRVNLDGEAFFEVEKGSKFSVVTANGIVQVLGTKFNVYSRGDAFVVKCTEGKVSVSSANSKEILMAGDVVELSDESLNKIPFQAKMDWRQKAYDYRGAALSQVFEEIERQFDVKVTADPAVLSQAFTGPLETKDLEKALYMVTWPMNMEYSIDGNSIEIIKK